MTKNTLELLKNVQRKVKGIRAMYMGEQSLEERLTSVEEVPWATTKKMIWRNAT